MLSTLSLLLNGLVFTLRLSGGSFPRPLSAEEERRCLQAAAQGDQAARSRLIEHNLRLVAHIMKKYYSQSGDQEDLISIGTIGLIKAINTYDPGKNIRLATYASRCIENEVLMHLRKTRRCAGEVSLSEALDADPDGGSLAWMDVIQVEDSILESLNAREDCRRVRRYVAQCLLPREQEIITLRYGLDGSLPRTQREVAASCGISRSYVSRIEKRALAKLEQAMGQPD